LLSYLTHIKEKYVGWLGISMEMLAMILDHPTEFSKLLLKLSVTRGRCHLPIRNVHITPHMYPARVNFMLKERTKL